MIVYLAFIGLVISSFSLDYLYKKEGCGIFALFAILLTILLDILRYYVGYDYDTYSYFFGESISSLIDKKLEWGFIGVVWFLHLFEADPFWLFFCFGVGIIGFILHGVKLYTRNVRIAFLIYLGYLLWMAKKGKEDNEPDEKQKSLPVQLLMILAGLICIVLGSDFVVDGATEIAKVIGISDRIIGLTIVAFGTSLPELVTSIAAARRGNADIAIGNIVGSNVFNILFVAGTSALISPVVFESKFVLDTAVATATAVLLLVCVCNKEGKLKRSGGIIMLAAYAAYFVKLLIG